MQEDILLNKSRTGTKIHYFNVDINEYNFSVSTTPAIVKLNSSANIPLELSALDGVFLTGNSSTAIWRRNFNQNFEIDSYLPNLNFISGRTFSETVEYLISNQRKSLMEERFKISMNNLFTAGTTTYVFFEDIQIDDLFVNVKLERTFDVLNTLNIYNKVEGELTQRESPTGVVFGKLEAIQKLSDAEGNRIRIPLRNVPIGVFVPSDDYPDPNTMDDDGNRLRLNYKTYPVTKPEQYFNSESFDIDNKFLIDIPLSGTSPHPTFQNVVYTNQNGEFVLHDVEVGGQVLFFEVDLLKQGLTKDEVALNFFPYPPSFENVSIDTIPHFFYRAIPIDVVPSWGISFQTGYTEVDIAVNLDLRKWATYIIPPVTYREAQIGSVDYQKKSRAPLTVKVRDMSRFNSINAASTNIDLKMETYPSKQIQMVEIQNIIDKNEDQQWEWANEFSQIKDKALFYTYGYHAVKLPANIYDDENYKTDKYGDPKINEYSKGVWLCGYQLKVYLTLEDLYYRTTGMEVGWHQIQGDPWFDRDNFHCSLYNNIDAFSNSSTNRYEARGEGIGIYPYEKAWTKSYPIKYSIPKKPSIPNFDNPYNQRTHMETPVWKDGDLILGNSYEGVNGFGMGWNNNTIQYTDFATDIIGATGDADMYKYEPAGNDIAGCYANGYTPSLDWAGLGATSSVVNAETYQRIEAGYGYFLFPSSFPRIITYPWYYDGFHVNETDYELHNASTFTSNDAASLGYQGITAIEHHYHSFTVGNNGKTIAMDLSDKMLPNNAPIINDRLNIYRIIDGRNRLPYTTKQKLISTSLRFNFGGFCDMLWIFQLKNTGDIDVKLVNEFSSGTTLTVYNPSGGTPVIVTGQPFWLNPGGYFDVDENGGSVNYAGNARLAAEVTDTSMLVPGNYNYSEVDNKYTQCKYEFYIGVYSPYERVSDGGGAQFDNEGYKRWEVIYPANISPITWYLTSVSTGGSNDKRNGCNGVRDGVSQHTMQKGNHSYSMYNVYFDLSRGPRGEVDCS